MNKKLLLIPALIAGLVVALNYFPKNKSANNNVAMAYAKLPLSFIENRGQADKQVKFYVKGSKHSIYFADHEIVYASADSVIHQKFVGASGKVNIQGSKKSEGKVNYLVGKDPKNWKTNIPTYEEVIYKNLYPGIDLAVKGESQGKLKSEYRVAVGADYKKILVAYDGIDELKMSDAGDMVLKSAKGEMREQRPYIYQVIDGRQKEVKGRYVLAQHGYRFELESYDPSLALVIDPTLIYSTYLGGSGDDAGEAIAVDSAGNIYVTGRTASADFPITTTPLQAIYGGGSTDVFVTKLNPSGSALIYSTYLGGFNEDYAGGGAVTTDSAGNVYVTGWTYSTDFPTTASSFQTYMSGGGDAFVAKLNPSGSTLIYSTYLGGRYFDGGHGIAVDSAGNTYITGWTYSANFPTTASSFQAYKGGGVMDAFVTKLNPSGSALIYSTYLGGFNEDYGHAIVIDSAGNAYITGWTNSLNFPIAGSPLQVSRGRDSFDAFVTKLNTTGSALVYSTYLGGSSNDAADDIAIDSTGNVYVTGRTYSTDFPTTGSPLQATTGGGDGDVFVSKINASGSALVYSTYIGGDAHDEAISIALDTFNNAYVTGTTSSSNFPTVSPLQASRSGNCDAFVSKINASGSALIYSTYLGGSFFDSDPGNIESEIGGAIAVDAAGNAYVTGTTHSTDFPTASPLQATKTDSANSGDAFIAKIGEPPPPPLPNLIIPFARVVRNNRSTSDLSIVVANSGRGAATGPFSLQIITLKRRPPPPSPGSLTIPVLRSGESLASGASRMVSVSAPAGDIWSIRVDSGRQVTESDESNNNFTLRR